MFYSISGSFCGFSPVSRSVCKIQTFRILDYFWFHFERTICYFVSVTTAASFYSCCEVYDGGKGLWSRQPPRWPSPVCGRCSSAGTELSVRVSFKAFVLLGSSRSLWSRSCCFCFLVAFMLFGASWRHTCSHNRETITVSSMALFFLRRSLKNPTTNNGESF